MLSGFTTTDQRGRTYAFTFSGDWNGDGRSTNDLMYVCPPRTTPRSCSSTAAPADLGAYVANDAGLQSHARADRWRRALRAPWTDQLDMRAALGIPDLADQDRDHLRHARTSEPARTGDWGVVDSATFGDPERSSSDRQRRRADGHLTSRTSITRAGYASSMPRRPALALAGPARLPHPLLRTESRTRSRQGPLRRPPSFLASRVQVVEGHEIEDLLTSSGSFDPHGAIASPRPGGPRGVGYSRFPVFLG